MLDSTILLLTLYNLTKYCCIIILCDNLLISCWSCIPAEDMMQGQGQISADCYCPIYNILSKNVISRLVKFSEKFTICTYSVQLAFYLFAICSHFGALHPAHAWLSKFAVYYNLRMHGQGNSQCTCYVIWWVKWVDL